MRRKLRTVATAVAAGVLLVAVSGATPAAATSPIGADSQADLPMEFAGYDAAAAEAHGYSIVTDASGVTRSVPVSTDAIAYERQLERAALSRTKFVDGPCGSSWINAQSSGQRKVITTGYTVTHPVIAKNWTVQVWGWSGLPSYHWGGASGATWFSSWSYNGGGDFANVLPGSNVVMSNGAVCVSGSPGENFHS